MEFVKFLLHFLTYEFRAMSYILHAWVAGDVLISLTRQSCEIHLENEKNARKLLDKNLLFDLH